jgi:hypothetical protein
LSHATRCCSVVVILDQLNNKKLIRWQSSNLAPLTLGDPASNHGVSVRFLPRFPVRDCLVSRQLTASVPGRASRISTSAAPLS